MELRDALRMLRSEIGLTQSELASAVNVGFTAASRWENKNTRPNRASSAALISLAQRHCVSAACLDALTTILLSSRADDVADKEKLRQVTERLKLEERVLLTNEQMKTTIDKLDLAVIAQRIRSACADGVQVIYQNRRYAEMFGFTAEEFEKRCRENIYFCISPNSRDEYLRRLEKLISGQLPLCEFVMTLQGEKKDGSGIWLEIKGIDLTQYSYGYELFLSCRDVTQRVEAEQKYALEVAVRDATLQGLYTSFYCDLTADKVLRSRDLDRVVYRVPANDSVDDTLFELVEAVAGNDSRGRFIQSFDRQRLLSAYETGNALGSAKFFNTVARRWLRCDHVLIRNPYTGHIEAAVYLYDIQTQTLAEKMMTVVADHFFEYIGLIDAQLGSFEAYYYSANTFKSVVDGKRDYRTVCEEKLRCYTDPREYEENRAANSLETVKQKLSNADFYSTQLRLKDYNGSIIMKKVTFTYLDDTHTMIVVGQSNVASLNGLFAAGRAQA